MSKADISKIPQKVGVIRKNESEVQVFKALTSRIEDDDDYEDGTYYFDKSENKIYFYSKYASTFAFVFSDSDNSNESESSDNSNTSNESESSGNSNTSNESESSNNSNNSGSSSSTPTTQTEVVTVTEAEKKTNQVTMDAGLKLTQTGSKLTAKWSKASGAEGYKVYVAYNGKAFPKVATVTTKSTKVSISKLNGKKLNTKKNFKVYVEAYKTVNGQEVSLGKTITAYVAGAKNTKATNAKSIKITSKTKLSLKVGAKSKIKAKTVKANASKKLLSSEKEFRYASSNESVATVDKKGKITAKAAGKCTVYVYSRNGYAKKIQVTVK